MRDDGGYSDLDLQIVLSGKWCRSLLYVNTAGGTIEYYQGDYDGLYPDSRARSAGATSAPVQLGSVAATLITYRHRYAGNLLSWKRNGINYFLDGSGVDSQELVKMAKSTLPRSGKVRSQTARGPRCPRHPGSQ